MHFKNIFIIRIHATSLFKITYSSQSSQLLHLHSTHCQPALRVQASTDYCLICDDPVSFQSLVCWVRRQSRLVELIDAPLSRQYTSRSAFSCVLTPTSQGVLNLLFGILQRPLIRSLGTKNGLQLLPPTLDIQSASVRAKSKLPQRNHSSTHKSIELFRIQLTDLHICHLSI